MGSQNKMLVEEHRNNPKIELCDEEMINEKIAKKRLDEIMDESERD